MFILIRALTLALLFILCTSAQAGRVQIVNTFTNDGSRCTGSIVAQGYVLTARHCTRGLSPIRVIFESGLQRVFKPVVVGGGPVAWPGDWALLKGDTADIVPLDIAKVPPYVALDTLIIAKNWNGKKLAQREFRLKITAIKPLPEGLDIQFAGLIRKGDSGSPILNANGEVVAVAHSDDGKAVSYGAGVEKVRRYLEVIGAIKE